MPKAKKGTSKKSKKRWIQQLKNLDKGALRDYLRENRQKIKRKYGEDPFTEQGSIRVSILRKLSKDKDLHLTTRRRAQLTLNLRNSKRG